MEQSQNPKPYRRQLLLRLVRIALMALSLLLLSVFLLPAQFLPPDMTLGEFLQALLGVLMLSGILRTQTKDCLAAGRRAGFVVERVVTRGKWVTALGRVR